MDTSNKNKIILDLCAGTGSWSKPYKEEGYDVRLVTLPEYDVRTYIPPPNVYGILAAPPCAEFSIAKGSRPRDFQGAMVTVWACLDIIWACRLRSKLAFWCMENPRGFLRQFMGKPPLTVRYWQFGDAIGKPTDLWGYYNAPKPRYTEPPALLDQWDKSKGLRPVQNMSRSEVRAKTPPGFALAFFEVNR